VDEINQERKRRRRKTTSKGLDDRSEGRGGRRKRRTLTNDAQERDELKEKELKEK
jgi:hypothetical protein